MKLLKNALHFALRGDLRCGLHCALPGVILSVVRILAKP
jgi:hypothetical protein